MQEGRKKKQKQPDTGLAKCNSVASLGCPLYGGSNGWALALGSLEPLRILAPSERAVKKTLALLALLSVIALVFLLTLKDGSNPKPPLDLEHVAPEPEPEAELPVGLTGSDAGLVAVELVDGGADQGRSTREDLAVLLSGDLSSPEGQAVVGALLTWTPMLPQEESGSALRSSQERYENIQAATLSTTSDAAGHFEFGATPEGLGELPSVIWVSHAEWEAKAVMLAPNSQGLHWPSDLELIPAQTFTVRVVGISKRPVAGATVRLRLTKALPDAAPNTPESLAREFLWREYATDAAGESQLPSVPGEAVVQAFQGDKLSDPWSDEDQELVELTLADGFSIEGRVTLGDLSPLKGQVYVSVALFDDSGERPFEWSGGRIYVGADGHYGPTTIPLLERDSMYVMAWGFNIQRGIVERPIPAPGMRVQLDFEVLPAESATILVVDGSGQPIKGAEVSATVFDTQDVRSDYRSEDPTDADGLGHIGGLPPGNAIFSATCDGYVKASIGIMRPPAPQCTVPRPEEEGPFIIELMGARRISGRVVHAGKPVPVFKLACAEEAVFPRTLDVDDENGEFEILAAKGTPISLFASSKALPQSELHRVEPGDDDITDLELELPRPRLCRGQLMDRVTGKPIVDADIWIMTTINGYFAGYRGDVYRPDESGHFELPGFTPGSGGLTVVSPGYQEYVSMVHNNHGEIIEFGVVNLLPTTDALVRVVGWPGPGFENFSVSGEAAPFQTPRPLGADGTLLMEGVPATRYKFSLQCPDGSVMTRSCALSPRNPAEIIFEVQAGGSSLEIEVSADTAKVDLTQYWLSISQVAPSGEPMTRQVYLPADGKLSFSALMSGETIVSVLDENFVTVCLSVIDLGPAEHRSLKLDAGAPQRRIQLLDNKRQPIENTTVIITLPEKRGGWFVVISSDSNGEFTIAGADSDEVCLTFSPRPQEYIVGLHVALEPNPERTTTVVCEQTTYVSALLTELGQPCAGVRLLFEYDAYPVSLPSLGYSADQQGLVEGYMLPPGELTFAIKNTPYWPDRMQVQITQGMKPVPMELYSRGTLAVTAKALGTSPLPGVSISLEHERFGSDLGGWIAAGHVQATNESPVTDEKGELRLEDLPRGHYSWTARFPNGTQQSGELDLQPHGLFELELRE